MRRNFTANRFVFRRTNCGIVHITFSLKLAGRELPECVWISRQQLYFWTHKLRKCAQNFFYKACMARTSKMRLKFTANSFIFGHINRGIGPRTFFVKLAGGELPECVWISGQTASFLDAKIVKLRTKLLFSTCRQRTFRMRLKFTTNSFVFRRINCGIATRAFAVNLAGRELLKCVWTPHQSVSFLDAYIGKMRPEHFYKAWKAKVSKMCLNFTKNRSLFGLTNRGIAPRTFSVKLAGRELPKCV